MVFNRLGFAAVVLISFLLIGRLWSQEAVDLERSAKPAEETTPEPSTTPEKSAKKEASEKPTRGVEETMRPEEFKAAGLDKLNEDELQHLDAYLQGYRESAKKKAAEQAQATAHEEIKKANEKAEKAEKATAEAKVNARTKLDSLVSRVDGNIDGVKGHAVIRLEDGTVWKQVNA